jgi:hypothetical protein
MNNMTGRSY